ncbi:MAG: hypothetical protein R2710_05840 [Acidimicrobiales bacterium]
MINVKMPRHFSGVGEFYQDFSQTTDEEVLALLERANRLQLVDTARPPASPMNPATRRRGRPPDPPGPAERSPTVPEHARGVVVFAHGSGSGRHSPQPVRRRGPQRSRAGDPSCSTCSPPTRSRTARRSSMSSSWLVDSATSLASCSPRPTSSLPVAYFGASTGAAAALAGGSRAW